MSAASRWLTVTSAVGAGASGGVFLAFSSFVMRALGRLPAAQGIAAMQAINRAAPNPLFMTVLFGTAATSAVAAVPSLRHLDRAGDALHVAGTAVYLGCVVLTIAYHVPRNNALDALDPTGPASAAAWATYRSGWTAWNHVRTASGIGAAALFAASLRHR